MLERTIRYAGDVKDDVTGEEASIALPKIKAQLSRTQRKVKLLRGQNKRLKDRMDSIQDLINNLRSNNLLSDASNTILQDFSSNRALFEELKSRTNGQPCSDALRSFATTLHFYSPKAYSFVRSVFNNTLPHPRTIIRWYESINGEPGITKESLDAIKLKAAEMTSKGKPLLGCLMMDEMAIRQQVVWNEQTQKLEGVAQLNSIRGSTSTAVEQALAAKEALVFMVTGVQNPWKIPIAYFFIKGLTANEKKDIINTVLASLHEAGVTIIALTFDGTCTNIATVNALGCDIRGSSVPLKTSFKHPSSDSDVHVLLDPVHMLKLVRNTFHSQKVLTTPNGIVKWEYIEKLNRYQSAIGLKLAQKLSDKHVYFENSKMKVLLAVQVISNSVATALDQLSSVEPDFADCAATVEFLHLFNDLFDLTNSMDEEARGFKKPLSVQNFDLYHEALAYVEHFIRGIKLANGSKVLESRCKTGFLGFLVAIESFKNLYKIYVEEMGAVESIFTYRFSQDHLEHFFGAMRAKSGSNNNPNAIHFKASYKRLIVNNEIKNPCTGNCHNFDNVETLKATNVVGENTSFQAQEQLNPAKIEYHQRDYETFMMDEALNITINTHCLDVQRKLLGGLKCRICSIAMNKASTETIVSICKATEFEFKRNSQQRNLKTTILTNFIKKMAFTGSLRKTLFGLLLVMVCLVMLLYWNENQSSLKPAGSAMLFAGIFHRDGIGGGDSGGGLGGLPPLKVNSPEKSWTYKCVNNRCVRQHYIEPNDPESAFGGSTAGKRVPFLTCTITCGPINIWPQPTGKSSIGSKASRFRLSDVHFNVQTAHKPVEDLLWDAFRVFKEELQAVLVAHGAGADEGESSTVTESGDVARGKGQHNGGKTEGSAAKIRFYKVVDDNRYDVDRFDVRINVLKSPDIHLTMHTDESYNMSVGHTARSLVVKVFANSFFGAKHALTTLQQLVWFDDEDRILKVLNKALIEDVPRFNFRGLMLDTSRHFFSVESIKRTLVGMSHSKLNRFHWHITDSQSFPLVSKHYPQLAQYGAYSDREIYTTDDVREIVQFAKVRGIQVIPEIDAPAHAGNGWDWGPKHNLGDLSLCINQQPWSYYCGEPPCGQLNPKNNNTYLILQKLYEELLELTGPLDYFHLGGDEVNLECWQQHFNESDMRTLWCDFMQQAYHRLQIANKGVAPKMVAVWSSGLTNYPCLSKNSFAVQVWGGSKWQENYQLISAGYNLVISHVDAWYLDCGFGSWRSTAEGACSPYRNWQTVYKHRPWDEMKLTSLQMRQILGGEACLWTEQVDESTLDSRLWPRASALAERLWTDPVEEIYSESVPKDTFNRMSVFRNHLLELGLRAEPIFPKYCAQNQDECV